MSNEDETIEILDFNFQTKARAPSPVEKKKIPERVLLFLFSLTLNPRNGVALQYLFGYQFGVERA